MSELRLTFSYIWNSFVNGRMRIGGRDIFFIALMLRSMEPLLFQEHFGVHV